MRREKESNTSTRDNDTPDNAEDPDHPKQDEREEGQVNPDELADHEDSEDSNYLPVSEEDVSLGDEDFIVPEEPLEQEHFKRWLIATARSLKKKQQQIQAEQDMLNDRWTKVLAAEEGYGFERSTKSYAKRRLLSQFDDEAFDPILSKYNHVDQPDQPPCGRDKTANYAEYQSAPPRHRGRETAAPGYMYDLC